MKQTLRCTEMIGEKKITCFTFVRVEKLQTRHVIQILENSFFFFFKEITSFDLIYPFHLTGTGHVGYNRMKFLIESLADLDRQFKLHGGPGLFIFRGNPVKIFRILHKALGINKICYEQDCEPIWQRRDREIVSMCRKLNIQNVEMISHTLWNPRDIIKANGGYAPLTYQMMLHTVNVLGLPQRPVNEGVDFSDVTFGNISNHLAGKLGLMSAVSYENRFFFREHDFSFITLRKNKIFMTSTDSVPRRLFRLQRVQQLVGSLPLPRRRARRTRTTQRSRKSRRRSVSEWIVHAQPGQRGSSQCTDVPVASFAFRLLVSAQILLRHPRQVGRSSQQLGHLFAKRPLRNRSADLARIFLHDVGREHQLRADEGQPNLPGHSLG